MGHGGASREGAVALPHLSPACGIVLSPYAHIVKVAKEMQKLMRGVPQACAKSCAYFSAEVSLKGKGIAMGGNARKGGAGKGHARMSVKSEKRRSLHGAVHP